MRKFAEAETHLKKCIEIRVLAHGETHKDVGSAYSTLLGVYMQAGRLEEAEAAGLKAYDISKQLFGENSLQAATDGMYLGQVYQATGRIAEAIKAYTQFIAAGSDSSFSQNNPDIAKLYERLIELHLKLGQFAEAEHAALQAIKIHRTVVGEQHRVMSVMFHNLMQVYEAWGRFELAEACALKSFDIYMKVSGKPDESLYSLCITISRLYVTMGRLPEAADFGEKSLKVQQVMRVDDMKLANTYNYLAKVYQGMGKYEEAESYVVSLISLLEQQLGAEHQHTARAYHFLADVYRGMNRVADAATWALKGLNALQLTVGEHHQSTVDGCVALVTFYGELGQWEQAEEYARRAVTAAESIDNFDAQLLETLKMGLEKVVKRRAGS